MSRLPGLVRRRPLVSSIGAIVMVAVGAWLAVGFLAIQTLFIDGEVHEAGPFVAGPGPSGLAVDATTEDMADAMNAAMEELGVLATDAVDDPMAPDVTVLAEGSFGGRAHPTSGTAKVITDTVFIWCVRFSVAFGAAPLS